MSNNLETKLTEYAKTPAYPFHMPGHKRIMNPMESSSVATVLAGTAEDSAGIYALDITEIDGFDNLHDPQEILKTEMERAANLWGARKTWFSVNGSTCAILAAISAAAAKGGRIHIERGCHMSVYHAAYLRELSLSYIDPNGGKHRQSRRFRKGRMRSSSQVRATRELSGTFSSGQMPPTKREPFSSSTKPTALTLASTHIFRNQPCVSVPTSLRRAPTRRCQQ